MSLDSGLPCQHGAGERFDTEAQRARAFQIYQSMMFETPSCIGSDYFMWADQPAGGMQSASNPEDCSYGLVKENDEPYPILAKAATEINRSIRPSSAASRIWWPSLGRLTAITTTWPRSSGGTRRMTRRRTGNRLPRFACRQAVGSHRPRHQGARRRARGGGTLAGLSVCEGGRSSD